MSLNSFCTFCFVLGLMMLETIASTAIWQPKRLCKVSNSPSNPKTWMKVRSEHIDNCVQEHYNGTVWICDQCEDGYCPGDIDHTDCEQGPPECKSCNEAGECLSCYQGWYLDGGKRDCFRCAIDDCYSCDNGFSCQVCNDSSKMAFSLNGVVKCTSCSEGCSKCQPGSMSYSCDKCQDGYTRTEKKGGRYYCQKSIFKSLNLPFTLLMILIVIGIIFAISSYVKFTLNNELCKKKSKVDAAPETAELNDDTRGGNPPGKEDNTDKDSYVADPNSLRSAENRVKNL